MGYVPELALQHVSMILRSEVNYEVVKPVPEIGWRLRKHYFLVKSRNNPKEEMLLSWVEHGPDKYLEDRDLHGVFKSISSLQVSTVISHNTFFNVMYTVTMGSKKGFRRKTWGKKEVREATEKVDQQCQG
jgi:PX domain-containing protein kinase-like protein